MSKIEKKNGAEVIEIELPPEQECPLCGCRGAHFCVGTRNYKPRIYVGVRSRPPWAARDHSKA